MQELLERCLAEQVGVLELSTALAEVIAVPPGRRDGARVNGLWAQIDARHASLHSLRMSMARAERASDRADSRLRLKSATERRALVRRLALWPLMATLIPAHAAPEPRPLIPRNWPPDDPLMALVHEALHRLANPNAQSDQARAAECYPDIPLGMARFDAMCDAAHRLLLARGSTATARFLDVGCGGGTKCLAATRYFAQCDGLEYDPVYARAGQDAMAGIGARAVQVIEGDALRFDDYGAYDVIYFYRPISEPNRMREMCARIAAQARPGTVVLCPIDGETAASVGGLGQVAQDVFVAGTTGEALRAQCADAERVGPGPVRRSAGFDFDTGFWAPLLDAASLPWPEP